MTLVGDHADADLCRIGGHLALPWGVHLLGGRLGRRRVLAVGAQIGGRLERRQRRPRHGAGRGGGRRAAAGRWLLVVVVPVGQDDGDHDRGDDDRHSDRPNGQGATTTGLLAAFPLPLQFALGIRTSLFVGRHRRYPSLIAGWVRT